jgi:hypothetical protein
MQLVKFEPSRRKRFVATFTNPDRIIHFGTKNTYVDHHNKHMRDNHVARRAFTGVTEDGLCTAILWGPTISIEGNLERFLLLMNISDERT